MDEADWNRKIRGPDLVADTFRPVCHLQPGSPWHLPVGLEPGRPGMAPGVGGQRCFSGAGSAGRWTALYTLAYRFSPPSVCAHV